MRNVDCGMRIDEAEIGSPESEMGVGEGLREDALEDLVRRASETEDGDEFFHGRFGRWASGQ